MSPNTSPPNSPAKSGWFFIVVSILRCSTLSSLKFEIIIRSRGKRPTSFGWFVEIWFCRACIRLSWRLFTFCLLFKPDRSKVNRSLNLNSQKYTSFAGQVRETLKMCGIEPLDRVRKCLARVKPAQTRQDDWLDTELSRVRIQDPRIH